MTTLLLNRWLISSPLSTSSLPIVSAEKEERLSVHESNAVSPHIFVALELSQKITVDKTKFFITVKTITVSGLQCGCNSSSNKEVALFIVSTTEEPPTCPPDKPQFYCLVDPCQVTDCPAHPDATCTADYCGGCNARFYDSDGNEVTDTCGELYTVPLLAIQYLSF